ncbi:MAG: FAD-binding oxidoreductase [Trueperaceae bacterium]|nr:FAD-binding oxidoreductase [Trueperaceae bacterium]
MPQATNDPTTSFTDLRAAVAGAVLAPGDAGYDDARRGWNLRFDARPAVVVEAASAADVVAAVAYARRERLPLAVQATGHSTVRPADGALLLRTGRLAGVSIDPAARTARVEAGATWDAVLAAAQPHGLAPLLGSSPTVGAVGDTLGGGLGWLARKHGLAADGVLRFEVVTADGERRIASATEQPDLFWGLRGGGGALGVVTAMTVRLFPVTHVYAGKLYYPAALAGEVFRRWSSWIADAPDELTSSVLLMNYPPVPGVPEPLRGQSFAIVHGCWCGDLDDGAGLMRYWRDGRAPTLDGFAPMPFTEAARISNDPADPMPGFTSGAWLRSLDDAASDAIVAHALPAGGPTPLVFAEVRHVGGAVARVPADTSAYGNRDAELVLSLVGVAPTAEAHAAGQALVGRLKAALAPALTGGVYLNFLEDAESRARVRDGLAPGAYERLARLKARFDGEHLFRHAFDVAPAV